MIRRVSIIACIALLASSFSAVALAATTKSKSKTVSVPKGATRTIVVAYPDALRYGNATYKGKVTVVNGKVKVLSKGSTQGGSAYQARVQNTGSGTASVKVTASTTH